MTKMRWTMLAVALAVFCAQSAVAETLSEAFEAAVAASRPVRAANQVSQSAQAGLEVAKARRLPVVTLSANHFRMEDKLGVTALGMELPIMDDSTTGVSAMTAVPLFTGGRITHGIEAAQSVASSSRYAELATISDIRYQTAVTYTAVIEAQAVLKAAQTHRSALQAHERQVQARLKKGMAVKNELYAAQAALMGAEDRVIAAQSALDSSKAAYNRLLDREFDQAVDLAELPADDVHESLAELTQRAVVSSTELAAMQENVRAARATAASENAARLPQIELVGGWMRQSNRYFTDDSGWVAGVVMKWDVFDGGLRSASAEVSQRQADALRERTLEAESMLKLAVKNAWLAWQEACARQTASEASLKSAEENLRVSSRRYAAGLSQHTEVLDAEALRQTAHARLVKAQNDKHRAAFKLRRLTDTL